MLNFLPIAVYSLNFICMFKCLLPFLLPFLPHPELSEQVADVPSDLKGENPWHVEIRSVILVTSDVE